LGLRALAVALLLVGLAGGYYVGVQKKAQQRAVADQKAAEVYEASVTVQNQRRSAAELATALKQVAALQAAFKTAKAAELAADRARKAQAAARAAAAAQAAAAAAQAAGPYTGPIPTSCNSYSGNRQIGCALLAASGQGFDQMACLDKLWTQESGWYITATNAQTGAYGIPQSLPGNKMASVGPDWQNSATTQIKWGLGYIQGRYGTPCNAWSHEMSFSWY
jgi:heat shock protein HslJ